MTEFNGVNQSFLKKLSKTEKLVLKGQKLFMTLAEARDISCGLVTLDWVSLVYDKRSIVNSPFWDACAEQCEPYGSSSIACEEINQDTLEDLRILRALVRKFSQITGFDLGEIRPGRNYYKNSWLLVNDQGEEVGCVSGGGNSQRDTFNFVLRGSGCTFAKRGWNSHLYEFSKSLDGRIARCDVALDLFEGEGGGLDSVRQAYLNGEFDYNGRRPISTQAGAWDHSHSRTYNIGARGSKSFTCYEKGHQYGLMDSKWWRAELRFGNQDRILPLSLLVEPDKFFAGAYPFTASLLESVEPEVIPTKKTIQDATAHAVVQRKMNWFVNTVAPSLVHFTKAYDVGMHGFMWLCDLAVQHAERPMPRSLRGIPKNQLSAAMRKCLSPIPLVPAELVPS